MSNMKKTSALIYEGTYQAISYLPEEAQLEAYCGIIEYGLYGIEPHSDNPFVNMVYVQAIPCMKTARDRYEKAVADGKRGGRPAQIDKAKVAELREHGLTRKEIAAELGTTENTIKSIIQREGAKGANLYDNVNDNDNVHVNDTENIEASQANIDKLDKLFKAAVKAEVEKRLAGSAPKGNSTSTGEITKEDAKKLSLAEINELMEKNPELYAKLFN